jgi:hypothetical protein
MTVVQPRHLGAGSSDETVSQCVERTAESKLKPGRLIVQSSASRTGSSRSLIPSPEVSGLGYYHSSA